MPYYWESVASNIGNAINAPVLTNLLLEFDRSGTFPDYSLSIYKCITDKQVDFSCVLQNLFVFTLPGIILLLSVLYLFLKTLLTSFELYQSSGYHRNLISGYDVFEKLSTYIIGVITGFIFIVTVAVSGGLIDGIIHSFGSTTGEVVRLLESMYSLNENILEIHTNLNASVTLSKDCIEQSNVLYIAEDMDSAYSNMERSMRSLVTLYEHTRFPEEYEGGCPNCSYDDCLHFFRDEFASLTSLLLPYVDTSRLYLSMIDNPYEEQNSVITHIT